MDVLHKLTLLVLVLSHLSVCCIATDYVRQTCLEQRIRCLDSIPDCNSRCRGDLLCQHRISTRRRCDREYCNLLRFECVHEGRCISLTRVCDGKKDCLFGLDELNCDTSDHTLFPEPPTSPNLIIQKLSTSTSEASTELSTTADHESSTPISLPQEPSTSTNTIHQEPSKPTIPINQDTSTLTDTILPQSSMSIDAILPETSMKTSAIFRESSCPDNYCMQNADCVAFLGQYHCNCPPSFTGKWCEIQLGFGEDARGYTLVISIAVTTIILCSAVASILICLCRRSPSRYSNLLGSKTDSQLTLAFYAKE